MTATRPGITREETEGAILALWRADDRDWGVHETFDALGGFRAGYLYDRVQQAISRLRQAGAVGRVRHGVYRIVEPTGATLLDVRVAWPPVLPGAVLSLPGLVRIDFEPPRAGPEIEVTLRAADVDGALDTVREAGMAVVAHRERPA